MSDRLRVKYCPPSPPQPPPPTHTHMHLPPTHTHMHLLDLVKLLIMRIDPFPFIFPFFIFWNVPVKNHWHCVYLWCGFRLLCVKSVEHLCENWTKVKQESGLSQADHPLLVGLLLTEIRVSLFWIQMNNTVAVIFSKMQILNGFQSTTAPLTEGGFPVGLCVIGVWCHYSGCQSAL